MDNIEKSELLELKTNLIKDIRKWKPSGGDAPDCFTMLYDYDEAVKKLTIPVVSNRRELLTAYEFYKRGEIPDDNWDIDLFLGIAKSSL